MRINITVFVTLCFGLGSMAQVGSVGAVSMKMSQGVQQGFKILVPEVDDKDAQRSWEKLIRGYGGKTAKVSKTNDFVSTNVLVPSIEDTAITIYSNFNETPDGVYLKVFVGSKGKYFNYSGQQSPAIQKLLKNFATATAFEAVNKRLEQEAKNLDKLEKEQRSLEKDKDAYEKEIKRAKETIEKRQKDLETNAKSQKDKQAGILEKKKEIKVMSR